MQADFVSMVVDTLTSSGLAPSLLELEITESKLVETVDINLKKLHELRESGVRFSIDDFGKGFSSLSYLKQLPVNTLKIDKCFVDDIPTTITA
jgi:EAL domain-containing protein (putative c-di-GMP-specific phosphodiesterase class I)